MANNEPNLLKVEATIPSMESAQIQLWHRGMFKPSIIAAKSLGQTAEQLLHRLGNEQLSGLPLSVDKQLGRAAIRDRLTNEMIDVSFLLTKPLNRFGLVVPRHYGWYNTAQKLNEDGESVDIGWVS